MKKVNGNKKATIYDIAAEVGTSTATVSRVLSKSGYPVKSELRNRIVQTAARMNYVPNMVGRMLKKSESCDIGVIIPNISNPFYPRMVLGIEIEARNRGYNILLCNSFREAATEKRYLESLYQKQVSGIILSSIGENREYLMHMKENGTRFVLVDQTIDELKCSRVGFDYIRGGMMAVEYLIKMGHRNIAFLSSPITRGTRKETLEGYRLALLKNDIQFRSKNVIISESEEEYSTGTYEYENGKNLVKRLLALPERPTAVFTVNDMTAFGVINELFNLGINVPNDISVIGFDNIELSSMIHPPLTTISQPAYETGRQACRLLMDMVENCGPENSGSGNVTMTLDPDLVIRNSVGKPAL